MDLINDNESFKANFADMAKKQTSLHYAAEQGVESVVKALLAKGADKSAKNSEDKTPIDLATDEAIINLL